MNEVLVLFAIGFRPQYFNLSSGLFIGSKVIKVTEIYNTKILGKNNTIKIVGVGGGGSETNMLL